jgi:ribosome-associated heat shock protein Hsp15
MPKSTKTPPTETRIDKWLWAARFFKTRSLAATAVKGGKVRINDGRAKPSRLVKPGDLLHVTRGEFEYVITIDVITENRGPAAQAIQLYTESEESMLQREKLVDEKRIERKAGAQYGGRPDKKDRRQLRRVQGKG